MPLFIPPDYFRELRREEIFPDSSRPLEIELGCGDGSFFLAMASHHPERDYLGLERMLGRVEKTLKKIASAGLKNAKIMRLESAYSTGWLLPTASVSRLHLICPDPWPKKKHAARRLVNQREFLDGLARILLPGTGEFLLKTDDAVYFEDAQASMAARPEFERLDWPENAFFYPTTDFESHWLAMGRSIHRARWRRL
ncbi:MAG: tRNA (guanosine(46)-N7)-methyltransferase TrmB [Prosthecobacter sp.]|nr:tRNA (guanosine(46)-N7)-methyltransferase TrmB [Prosthecobacter sp.]